MARHQRLRTRDDRLAPGLLLLVSAALLLGALAFQYLGDLAPCEMCYWQRYAHGAVILAALVALVSPNRFLTLLAILAMLMAAGLGLFHAGVEQHWWQGVTACTAPPAISGGNLFAEMLGQPLVRCDTIPWSLFGLSMAGWNAVISFAATLAAFSLWKRR